MNLKKGIYTIIILSLLLFFSKTYGQLHNLNIEIIKPNASFEETFYRCNEKKDNSYTGVDTVYVEDSTYVITVFKHFVKGQKVKAIGYYANGNIYRETSFKNLKLDGQHVKYYENGNKNFMTFYKEGEIIAPLIYWYDDGSLASYSDFKHGTDGNLKREWDRNGQMRHEVKSLYSDSAGERKLVGILDRYFHEDGTLYISTVFSNGVQPFNVFSKEGEKLIEGTIVDAVWNKIGKWEEWHLNGQKKSEAFYHDTTPNHRIGTWKYWDENGNLVKEEKYEEGKLVDTREYIPKERKQ